MATRKIEGPQIDDSFLTSIRGAGEPEPKEKAEPLQKEVKKACVTMKVNATTVKAWKQFCLDHDLTLTDAVKRAMAHYIKDVQKGTVEI